jgi:hypothetical protein
MAPLGAGGTWTFPLIGESEDAMEEFGEDCSVGAREDGVLAVDGREDVEQSGESVSGEGL